MQMQYPSGLRLFITNWYDYIIVITILSKGNSVMLSSIDIQGNLGRQPKVLWLEGLFNWVDPAFVSCSGSQQGFYKRKY